jgi:hypothetical protein
VEGVAESAPGLGQRLRKRTWEAASARSAGAASAVRGTPARIGASAHAAFAKLAEVAPDRALRLVRHARRMGRGSAFLAGAEAMLTARVAGWERATPLFERLVETHGPGAAAGLLRAQPTPPLDLALPDLDRAADLPPETAARIVVYTTALGAGPLPRPMFHAIPALRLVCLTDREGLALPGWEAAPLPAEADPHRPAAWARALPHRALAAAAPGAEASLYLGPETWAVGNLHTLLARWCHRQPLVLWRTEGAADWNDLAERHLVLERPARAAAVLAQARDCAARGLLPNRGAFDPGMIWRRHHDPAVRALMERWWAEQARHPDGLEGIALATALAEDPETRPAVLPAALGTAGDNAFTARLAPPVPRRRAAPAVAHGRIPVAMVYAEKYARSASTFLRGQQLAELAAAHHPEIDMVYTSELDRAAGRIAILTKGALDVHPAETIAGLGGRAIATLGSWDDMLPEPDKVAATDGSMTLSHRQTLDFARRFPDRPAFMVTHHVNTQVRAAIAGRTPPTDRARIGYFGFLNNTHRPKSLGRTVEYVAINTMSVEMDWLAALPRYNAHWIVRRNKPHDGAKPFLKGFVAAQCGAVVIVGRDDEDAVQYLGDDYPFYLTSAETAQMEYETAAVIAAFGGPVWARARAIMDQVAARSSDAQVAAEFFAMVKEVYR